MGKETKEQYAKKYAMASYSDEVCATDRYALGKRVGLERGIIIGAEWRINSVWHSVSQSPERNKIYLAQLGEEAFDTFYDSGNWDSFSKGLNIVRWAYIDDLTPKEE